MRLSVLLLPALLVAAFHAAAQPGTLDLSFNPGDTGFGKGDGPNNTVHAVAEQPDGKVIVGGEFNRFGELSVGRLIRLNADGTPDPSFNIGTGANQLVRSIAVLADGRILVSGGFQNINGVPRQCVAILLADGTVDPSFDPGEGPDNTVWRAIPLPNGKVLIGGAFTTVSGATAVRVARLNADGTLDPTFNVGTGPTVNISDMVLQPDGKLLVCGNFATVNGVNARGVVRLLTTGAVDNTFSTGSGPLELTASTMALQPDGKLIVGGSFTQFNGANRRRIVRLNENGSVDTSFQPGNGADNSVQRVGVQPDGKVLVLGAFQNFHNVQTQRIVRLNSNGTVDNSFAVTDGLVGTPWSLHITPDGRFYVGGWFSWYNGHYQPNIFRAFASGDVDPGFIPCTGLNSLAWALAVQPDGRILAGGEFSKYNGVLRRSLCRIWPDGAIDESFDTGEGFNDVVRAVAVQPDGRVVVTGDFTRFNGVTRNRIARLMPDGSLDESFDPGAGLSHIGRDLLLQPDGKILVGGEFVQVDGVNKRGVARLNSDGSFDDTFVGSGVNGLVAALTFDYDGRILIGGNFTNVNGVNRTDIARLSADGALDITFLAPASNAAIYGIIVQPDSLVLVCGGFSQMGPFTRRCMARLGINGAMDQSFSISNPNEGIIWTMALQPDGRILAGGDFNSVGGSQQQNFARLMPNGALDTSYMIGTAASSAVLALELQDDGSVYIGGTFWSYDGVGRNRLARINGDFTTSVTSQGIAVQHAWPNPCTDVLYLTEPFTGDLYDIRGAWLRSFNNTLQLPVHDLGPGVYLLRGLSGGVLRFVKE